MLRRAAFARQSAGLFACTPWRRRKRASKSRNPFPTASRTVLYGNASLAYSSASPSSHASQPAQTQYTEHIRNKASNVSRAPDHESYNASGGDRCNMTEATHEADRRKAGPLRNFDASFDFPKMEEEVLQLWRDKDAFRTSLKQSENKKSFSFFDGPPFATGLPHYGHILAGTIKDMVTRFAHQTGHHVIRRFGWDCHGLPIEFEIDKELGVKNSHDVERIGVAAYNEACEGIVMRYSSEWRKTVERVGRWIDFDNDYKTMQPSYMESVWWVFSELWKKGLVYRGYKVMPFSTGCTTPLSNFEANLNYKEVSDPSVMVAFQTEDDTNTYLLAWTTTPWTLPSNLTLCVNPDVDYVKVLDRKTGRHYVFAELRLAEVYPKKKGGAAAGSKKHAKDAKKGCGEAGGAKEEVEQLPYTIEARMKGTELAGVRYHPLFPYFYETYKSTGFRVLLDAYVTTEDGTGVVHQAPGFGEEDFRVCLENGVFEKGARLPCPVDENGCFTAEVTDFAGRYVKDADADVMKYLEQKGVLVHKGSVVHSYPFCWRSETPLLYKAVDSWFVKVESLRDRLVACNEASYWVPDFVKTRRFGNWLADARDWNVSRNRYWGTPLPIWHSEDWQEVVCVGSIAELERLSGVRGIHNLHRQFIDNITIPSARPGAAPLRRVSVVFDCWFESGSMPYAQLHYPFENVDTFKKLFPADFVAEGLDQTRGWFYTLLVLGVALFDVCPFRNVTVNGLILAEDGKKMSKRLKNYPEPTRIIDEYGADALRMYIINSPVVRGEPLRFRESGVKGMVKDIMLPLFNAAKFFIENANYCVAAGGVVSVTRRSTNEMDRWILASVQSLLRYVKQEMALYHLYNVVPGILRFIVDLSNWYVRMNRRRMKSTVDLDDRSNALSTALATFFAVSRIVAHIAPFVAEILYQRIKPLLPADQQVDSVHYLMIPDEDPALDDPDLERAMQRMITIVDLVRVLRDRMVIPLKRPVLQVVIVHPDPAYRDDVERVEDYIKNETNAFAVTLSGGSEYVTTHLDVNFEVLGRRLRGELPAIRKALQNLSEDEVTRFLHDKKGIVAGAELGIDDVKVLRKFREGITDFESNSDNDVVVLVDRREEPALIDSWRAREFVNRVQQLRKKAQLRITDDVRVYFQVEEEDVLASILKSAEQINQTIRPGTWHTIDKLPADAVLIAEEDNSISGTPIHVVLTRGTPGDE